MLSTKLTPSSVQWRRLSFASTLYLQPIVELLIDHVHGSLQENIRLGLQEALVNAATHGNQLHPHKQIAVEYCQAPSGYCWIISDQGQGFVRRLPCQQVDIDCPDCQSQWFPPDESEDGRGLGILMEVFDQVHWNHDGTRLHLNKKAPQFSLNLLQYVSQQSPVSFKKYPFIS